MLTEQLADNYSAAVPDWQAIHILSYAVNDTPQHYDNSTLYP